MEKQPVEAVLTDLTLNGSVNGSALEPHHRDARVIGLPDQPRALRQPLGSESGRVHPDESDVAHFASPQRDRLRSTAARSRAGGRRGTTPGDDVGPRTQRDPEMTRLAHLLLEDERMGGERDLHGSGGRVKAAGIGATLVPKPADKEGPAGGCEWRGRPCCRDRNDKRCERDEECTKRGAQQTGHWQPPIHSDSHLV